MTNYEVFFERIKYIYIGIIVSVIYVFMCLFSLSLSLSFLPPPPLSLSFPPFLPYSRASPAPHGIHPSQMQGIQAKGTQQQLSTPATPLAPNQPHQSYTHPMGTTPSTSYMQAGGSQMIYGNVNVPMGQQSRMQPGQGTSTSECCV